VQVYTSSTALLMKYGPDFRPVFLITTHRDLGFLEWRLPSFSSNGKSVRSVHSRDTGGNSGDWQGFWPTYVVVVTLFRLRVRVVKVNPVEPKPSCAFIVGQLTSGSAGHTLFADLAHLWRSGQGYWHSLIRCQCVSFYNAHLLWTPYKIDWHHLNVLKASVFKM